MKLGIMLAGRGPEDIHARLEQAREAGFSLCQLNLTQAGFTRGHLASIADSLVELGVRPLAVGCYVNPMRPDECSPMGATRADLDTLLHALDIIGARRVVLWSGTHSESVFDPHPDNAGEDSLDALRSFLIETVAATKARHYFLAIEPWSGHVLSDEERINAFHESLPPAVAERVRYVMDAPALLTEDRYADCDAQARRICRAIGESAGLIHLRDCVMPPDGDPGYPAPGQGKLDFGAYVEAIYRYAPPDAPAIIRNVPPPEFASIRDYLLRLSDRWELA